MKSKVQNIKEAFMNTKYAVIVMIFSLILSLIGYAGRNHSSFAVGLMSIAAIGFPVGSLMLFLSYKGWKKLSNENRTSTSHVDLVSGLLHSLINDHGFTLTNQSQSGMGEWFVNLENEEFTLGVSKDRGGFHSIEVGTKIRPRPGAHVRSWSLSHMRGFLEGGKDHFNFKNIENEVSWLERNKDTIFDSKLINSEELRKWAVVASRRLFNQSSQ